MTQIAIPMESASARPCLTSLPPEILHKVFYFFALSRGVTRALRLRLVCRTFYRYLNAVLFETRILDGFGNKLTFFDTFPMKDWRIRRHYGAQNLWHGYTVYRARNETDPAVGRYVDIRQIAQTLCKQTGVDYDKTLDELCWLALEHADFWPCDRRTWFRGYSHEIDARPPNPGLNLLSAAAHFGDMPLAKKLLGDGHSPAEHDLFPSPIFIAAFAGNGDVLKLFQDHLASSERDNRRDGVIGALQRDDLEMVKLAFRTPNSGTLDQPLEGVSEGPLSGISWYACHIRSRELYHYIWSLMPDDHLDEKFKSYLLAHYAHCGNLEMVQLLLDEGVDINKRGRHTATPLIAAANAFHEDLVDLLLKRGADPDFSDQSQHSRPLNAASKCGSLSIVRKLVEHGVSFDRTSTGWQTIADAVKREHTPMLEFLLKAFPDEKWIRPVIIERARTLGLESMELHFDTAPHLLDQ